MRKTNIALVGGTTIGIAAALYKIWYNKQGIKKRFRTWKNNHIRNAFYDTVTQDDVAWG